MTRRIFRSCLNIDVSGEERINPNLNQIDDHIHETGSPTEIQTSRSYNKDNVTYKLMILSNITSRKSSREDNNSWRNNCELTAISSYII